MSNPKNTCYIRTALKNDRGWTDELIEKLLGKPDDIVKSYKYRKAQDVRLYRKERVVVAESGPVFIAHLQDVNEKREDRRFAAQLKRKEAVNAMKVDVETIPLAELEQRLQKSWLADYRNEDKPEDQALAELIENPVIYDAEMVSFVKYNLLTLPDIPNSVKGFRDEYRAAVRLRDVRVYKAIGASYPSLANACEKIMAQRGLRDMA